MNRRRFLRDSASLLVPAMLAPAARAVGLITQSGPRRFVSGGPTYDAQLLYTSQDMTFVNDPGSNSVEWRTDEAQGYARITYAVTGVAGLKHTLVNQTSAQVYVSYYVRRHENPCSKQLKVNGVGSGADRNNYTFGPTANGYSDNECYLYYGDAVSGGNDNSVDLRMDGVLTGGGVFSRAEPTYTSIPARVFQDVTGTVWERYEVYAKFNSIGAKDGRFGIAKNGTRIFQLDDVYNCSDDANARFRDYIGIGEYTANGTGFFEDYKRVDISTSYVPSWMT